MAGSMAGTLAVALVPVAASAAPVGGCPAGGSWNLERLVVAMPGVDWVT